MGKFEPELEQMIEEATVDCYNDDEVFMGILYTLQEKLKFPFEAEVLGKKVKVVDIDNGKSVPGTGILTTVIADGKRHPVALSTIKLLDKTSAKGKHNAKLFTMHELWSQRH